MEKAKEKIIRALLVGGRKSWKQSELAKEGDCSKAFVSKLTSTWLKEGIIARPAPQEIVLVGAAKLLNKWAAVRKLPKPVYVKSRLSKEKIESILKKEKGYGLTLFSAAWHRTKFLKTNTVEIYVEKSKLARILKNLGKVSKEPTQVVLFPTGKNIFSGSEKIEGMILVPVVQNYVDLMSLGGTGGRAAAELARKYRLGGE